MPGVMAIQAGAYKYWLLGKVVVNGKSLFEKDYLTLREQYSVKSVLYLQEGQHLSHMLDIWFYKPESFCTITEYL